MAINGLIIQTNFARRAFPTIWRQVKQSRWSLAMIDCSTQLVCKALAQASHSCATPPTCFGAARTKHTSCDVSQWSNTIACATLPCNPGQNCTYTQGYWKNHADVWPLQSLTLGAVSYNASQLLQILNRPAQGNGLVILAHQLIAAKLNIANGANPTAVQQSVIDADTMIGGLIVPPIGNGYLSPSQTSELTDTLTEYNEGTIGPGHCDD